MIVLGGHVFLIAYEIVVLRPGRLSFVEGGTYTVCDLRDFFPSLWHGYWFCCCLCAGILLPAPLRFKWRHVYDSGVLSDDYVPPPHPICPRRRYLQEPCTWYKLLHSRPFISPSVACAWSVLWLPNCLLVRGIVFVRDPTDFFATSPPPDYRLKSSRLSLCSRCVVNAYLDKGLDRNVKDGWFRYSPVQVVVY